MALLFNLSEYDLNGNLKLKASSFIVWLFEVSLTVIKSVISLFCASLGRRKSKINGVAISRVTIIAIFKIDPKV